MDLPYKLVLTDGSEHNYLCETIDVTATTVTGINTFREIVFVAPVSQIKVLSK